MDKGQPKQSGCGCVQVVKHRADLATMLVSSGAAGALVDQVHPMHGLHAL